MIAACRAGVNRATFIGIPKGWNRNVHESIASGCQSAFPANKKRILSRAEGISTRRGAVREELGARGGIIIPREETAPSVVLLRVRKRLARHFGVFSPLFLSFSLSLSPFLFPRVTSDNRWNVVASWKYQLRPRAIEIVSLGLSTFFRHVSLRQRLQERGGFPPEVLEGPNWGFQRALRGAQVRILLKRRPALNCGSGRWTMILRFRAKGENETASWRDSWTLNPPEFDGCFLEVCSIYENYSSLFFSFLATRACNF